MSTCSQQVVAFGIAFLLTVLGWQQVMNHYVGMSSLKLAMFFPFLVLVGAQDAVAVSLSFVQWPLMAAAFYYARRRWELRKVLGGLVAIYLLAVVVALAILHLI